jgi:alcohol dehydrogenase
VPVEGPAIDSGMAWLRFRYASSGTRVWSGDVLERLDRELVRAGMSRVLLTCGATIGGGSPQLDAVLDAISKAEVRVFAGVRAGSPVEVVAAAVDAATSAGCDGIVALGGGSAVVTARAMAMPAAAVDRTDVGFTPLDVPYLVVPTTPTTAMARLGAALEHPHGQRVELYDPTSHPRAVLLDHDLLVATPAAVFLDTATATFCNAAELFTTPGLPSPARADLREAVELSAWALASWPEEAAGARDARAALAVAGFLCGRAADCGVRRQASIGMAVGHALQGLPGVTHGQAMAATLSGALRFNEPAAAAGQQRLLQVLRTYVKEVDSAAAACADLLGRLGMPTSPQEAGAGASDLVGLVPKLRDSHFARANIRDIGSDENMEAALVRSW